MPVVNTKQLKKGMITAADVLDRSGRLLFPVNTPLEEKHFRILQTWGIHALNIKGEVDEEEDEVLVSADPALVEECRKEVSKRFVLSDSANQVSREIYRLCVCRLVRQRQQGN